MSTRQSLIDAMQTALTALSSSQTFNDDLKAISTIQAGFGLLEAEVMPAEPFLLRLSLAHNVTMALATAVDQGFSEILGDKEFSSEEIGSECGLPKTKVATLLRPLAGRGIFKEVRPDVWANTKMSKALDSGLTISRIQADPIGRYVHGSPMTAWIQFIVEMGGGSSVAMIPAYREKKWKESFKASETPFNYGFRTELPCWPYLEQAEGGLRAQAFARMMELNNKRTTQWSNYPWSSLGPNATLVDVGGGVGSATACVLPIAPNITKAVIQDTPAILKRAEAYWQDHDPTALAEGKVVLQAHDFFMEQPVRGASAYLLRHIIHDWCEEDCVKILKHLHAAAAEDTKLIVVDIIVNHACHDIPDVSDAVEGAYTEPMPLPLPANGGRATEVDLLLDIHILAMLNGQERTYAEFKHLMAQAGWKPKRVYGADERQATLRILEFTKA